MSHGTLLHHYNHDDITTMTGTANDGELYDDHITMKHHELTINSLPLGTITNHGKDLMVWERPLTTIDDFRLLAIELSYRNTWHLRNRNRSFPFPGNGLYTNWGVGPIFKVPYSFGRPRCTGVVPSQGVVHFGRRDSRDQISHMNLNLK
jgi:hypothetical protein